VLANSAFTAGWIKQRWNVEAQVVFPPVTAKIEGRPKKNLIVSVGKFTGNVKHSKKQLEQVKAFREILGSSNADWTLRMLGFSDTADLGAYIEAVRESARGLAIEVVENASRADILKALAEAKVYWHTMGLDTDESKYPERAEHFGIATVEAMRAGCVPVVVASGGQREIVANGESGYLCSDLGQLVQATRSLMQDQDLLARMSMRATQRSFEFAPERFCSQITAITNEIFPGAISASSTADQSIAAGIEENVRS
jgi:glycosyltransferase involved in cell wall biosynthesis